MQIDWEKVGDQPFNIYDPTCGFWTDEGFTNIQHKAKRYTQGALSVDEKNAIERHGCKLMSA